MRVERAPHYAPLVLVTVAIMCANLFVGIVAFARGSFQVFAAVFVVLSSIAVAVGYAGVISAERHMAGRVAVKGYHVTRCPDTWTLRNGWCEPPAVDQKLDYYDAETETLDTYRAIAGTGRRFHLQNDVRDKWSASRVLVMCDQQKDMITKTPYLELKQVCGWA